MPINLTIAICAYNATSRLDRTLRALADQKNISEIQWELLLIDNASTDGTSKLAEDLGKQWKLPMRVVSEPRPGKINAIRTAVAVAAAPILSFLDDDNIVESDWIDQLLIFMREHPEAGIVGPRIEAIFLDPSSKPVDFEERYSHALAVRNLGDVPVQLFPPLHDGPPGAGMTGRTALFRTVLIDVACRLSGPKAGRLTRGEDSEICLIAHRLGWEMWYVPTMRMGHLLPPQRLNQAYLNRLIAEGSQSAAWLDYLRDVEPRGSRFFYYRRWAANKISSLKMSLLARLRRSSPQVSQLQYWKSLLDNRAAGYWELARDYPFEHFETTLANVARASDRRDGVQSIHAAAPNLATASKTL